MHRNFSKQKQNQMLYFVFNKLKSDFFAFDINYKNKNMKYFKIFEFYYNYTNKIASLIYSILDESLDIFLLVYSILYIAHK